MMAVLSYVAPAPCLGVCCPVRGKCACYRAVEGMAGHILATATCVTTDRTRPLFTAVPAVLERVA